jgi:single-strand DNA-binding protein
LAVSFRVACTPRRYDRQTGQWIDGTTNFFNVKAYGNPAQNFVESVGKGARVIVVGTIRTESWVPAEGGPVRSRQIVVADEIGPSTRYATTRLEKVASATSTSATEPTDEAPF